MMAARNARMLTRSMLIALVVTVVCGRSAAAAEHRVSSAAEVEQVTPSLQPGDVLVMADGAWDDQPVVFRGKGTAEKPITLRARTPGKVVLGGTSSVAVDGEHLVVSGLMLKGGDSAKAAVLIGGRHCRLTETALVEGTHKFYVRISGTDNRVDHCYLAGKTSEGPTLQVEVPEGGPHRHRIDHNHFGHRPPLRRNGGETIRVGYSHQSMNESGAVVERNLFDRCDGEIEIISSKSCGNFYRFNTFLDCAGMLTLRHGNRCRVEDNFFLGRRKRGSGGVRVIGEGHAVVNNYIEEVEQGGVWITSGIPDSPLNGYFRTRDCVIAFNTMVDVRGPCLELDAGLGTSRRTLRPENVTIANNLLAPAKDGTLLKGKEGDGFEWEGNLSSVAPVAERPGLRHADLKLGRAKDGLWRPTADSPVRAAAGAAGPKSDIDGQPRGGRPDVGCDQFHGPDVPVSNRPLTAADVGPSWRVKAGS
jgi:poly(beta-D-mannuronate) lyase